MKIPERDKSIIVAAKPNSFTFDQAFAIFWKRYEQTMKEFEEYNFLMGYSSYPSMYDHGYVDMAWKAWKACTEIDTKYATKE